MNRQAIREIAEMCLNLPTEQVDMWWVHSPLCKDIHCILGHAEVRGIIPNAQAFYASLNEKAYEWFGPKVTLTPQQIGYALLDELGVEHI